MTIVLPKKKQRILSFLKEYIDSRGYAPTLTEIAEELGVKSLATVHEHLAYLEEKGFIRRGKNQAREIEIIEHESAEEESYIDGSSVALPLFGYIAAGAPIEAVEDRTETVTVPSSMAPSFEDMFVLKVKGDSMIDEMIMDGDYVVIEKAASASNGDIVVALLEDGTATLKTLFKEKDHFRLQPANEKYEPIRVTQLDIQGKVRGVIRQMS